MSANTSYLCCVVEFSKEIIECRHKFLGSFFPGGESFCQRGKVADIREEDRDILVSLYESFFELLCVSFGVQVVNKLFDFVRNTRCDVLGNDAQKQTLLLLLLELEPEGGLDAAPLVEEASPHVDVGHVSEQPAHQVDARVEDDVRPELLVVVGPRPVALSPGLELVVDDVVGGGRGAYCQHRDADADREGHSLPDKK